MVTESFIKLFKKHRCLFDPTDPSYRHRRARKKSHEDLLRELNEISSHQLDMQDLKTMIRNYHHQLRRQKVRDERNNMPKAENMANDTFIQLVNQHRCLVDQTDPCYGKSKFRKRSMEILLKELNQISSYQLNIKDVKIMICSYQKKLRRERKSKKETLSQAKDVKSQPSSEPTSTTGESPLHVSTPHTDAKSDLGVTQDVQSQPSSVPTSSTGAGTSHTDAKSALGVVREANASTVDMIFKKHSCLLDSTQPCSKSLECEKNCQDDLLKEINQISSQKFTIEDLKEMIKNYQQKLQREKRKRKMENLPQIQDVKSLSSVESTSGTGVHIAHSDAESDLGLVGEEVDSPFDVVVKYEETSDEDSES